jgi:hypothetical protein
VADGRGLGGGSIHIEGPAWLEAIVDPALGPDAPDADRMAWVLDLLDLQVAERTGGPLPRPCSAG